MKVLTIDLVKLLKEWIENKVDNRVKLMDSETYEREKDNLNKNITYIVYK